MFLTVWVAILDLETGLLKFVNCGHTRPIAKLNGEFSFLKSELNLVLGVMENEEYTVNEIQLNPKDRLLLYTDGVTDANNLKKSSLEQKTFI